MAKTAATADFLIEIGTEELPPLALPVLERALADEITDGIHKAHLGFSASVS